MPRSNLPPAKTDRVIAHYVVPETDGKSAKRKPSRDDPHQETPMRQ
jgi:hypothetical protein